MRYSLTPFPGAVQVPDAWSPVGHVFVSSDIYDAWLESIGQKQPKPLEVLEVKPGKCDCGSESAGSSRHSTWCSAYEK